MSAWKARMTKAYCRNILYKVPRWSQVNIDIFHLCTQHSLGIHHNNPLKHKVQKLWFLFLSSNDYANEVSVTDVVRILLTISPTAIKHCSQICWQTLVYSPDYTNTYYHPALSHIKRKKRIWRKNPRWFCRTQMAWSRANALCSYEIRSGASCSKHG